ncbi:MAG: NosD domain-containing protein [Chloroflexota bacterium]|nr:NosD domain-containing protein [Chloroflexota bacterium]
MKTRYLLIPFACGLALTLTLLWILESHAAPAQATLDVIEEPDNDVSVSALADELHVCPSGCTYSSVQDAVDDANTDDIIKVATGTYTDLHTIKLEGKTITQVVCLRKTVTIRGGYTTTNWTTSDPDANPTTLDARGQSRVFYIASDIAPVIEGLRITGGNASGEEGGGVYGAGAAVTFRDNKVFSNTADSGGGLYLRAGEVVLNGNTIYSNTASRGGGMYLIDCSDELGDATLEGNIFTSNTATGRGGGLLLLRSDETTLSNNVVAANVAADGGGLFIDDSNATLTNNIVADNQASGAGSGLYINTSAPRLLHTTITRNSGNNGVYVTGNSDSELINTILTSHTVGINVATGNVATLDATLWYANTSDDWVGNVVHTNNRSGNPDFVAPGAGDYHINHKSAAIDRGVDAGVNVDMDGDGRPWGNTYDIGADEFPSLLSVIQQASPVPARAGESLVYTVAVVNFSTDITFTATITDTLPDHVAPTGVLTWTSVVIPAESSWTRQIIVTVDADYSGMLTNTVEITTTEGIASTASLVVGCYVIYLPLVFCNY